MSVFDKLLDTIKLNDDDYDEDGYLDEDLMDDDEEGDFFDDDPMDDKPKKKFFEKFGRKKEDDFADEEETFKEEPIHTAAVRSPQHNRYHVRRIGQILPLRKHVAADRIHGRLGFIPERFGTELQSHIFQMHDKLPCLVGGLTDIIHALCPVCLDKAENNEKNNTKS